MLLHLVHKNFSIQVRAVFCFLYACLSVQFFPFNEIENKLYNTRDYMFVVLFTKFTFLWCKCGSYLFLKYEFVATTEAVSFLSFKAFLLTTQLFLCLLHLVYCLFIIFGRGKAVYYGCPFTALFKFPGSISLSCPGGLQT